MKKFSTIYESYKEKKLARNNINNNRYMRRAGYGYIKRRVGLLSSEVDGPIYLMKKTY